MTATLAFVGAGCGGGTVSAPASAPAAAPPTTTSAEAPARTANGFVGSCDVRSDLGMCYEYVGAWWDTSRAKDDCATAPGGVFSATAHCPTAKEVATCPYDPQKGKGSDGTITYVFYAPTTPAQAKASCPDGNVTPVK